MGGVKGSMGLAGEIDPALVYRDGLARAEQGTSPGWAPITARATRFLEV